MKVITCLWLSPGALYGILVAFAFFISNVSLFLIFIPIPIKAKYFVPILIAGDLFFGVSNSFSIGPIAHCTYWRGFNGFSYDDLLEKKSIQNRWDL